MLRVLPGFLLKAAAVDGSSRLVLLVLSLQQSHDVNTMIGNDVRVDWKCMYTIRLLYAQGHRTYQRALSKVALSVSVEHIDWQ